MNHPLHHSLPGQLSSKESIEQMIRVNHAGEYGAKRIYEGQLAVLKHKPSHPVISHMLSQELEHLRFFEQALVERKVRPTLLHPLWHIAGFLVGAGTALLGEKAAMACTTAVEEVIDLHYEEQLQTLKSMPQETELAEKITQFQKEELEHRDTAIEHHAQETPGYLLLTQAIKLGSRAAIWLAKRF